jgi:hypothetical protein
MYGSNRSAHQSSKRTKIQGPCVQPLPVMWESPSVLSTIPHVSSLFAESCTERANSWFDESKLVGGRMGTDPIADFLTRIRNAIHARKDRVDAPWSRLKEALAKVLQEEGFIGEFSIIE